MNPSGKPVMGIQAQNLIQNAHSNGSVVNNNASQSNLTLTTTIPLRSPIVITTPPSPLIQVRHLPGVTTSGSVSSGTEVQKSVSSSPSYQANNSVTSNSGPVDQKSTTTSVPATTTKSSVDVNKNTPQSFATICVTATTTSPISQVTTSATTTQSPKTTTSTPASNVAPIVNLSSATKPSSSGIQGGIMSSTTTNSTNTAFANGSGLKSEAGQGSGVTEGGNANAGGMAAIVKGPAESTTTAQSKNISITTPGIGGGVPSVAEGNLQKSDNSNNQINDPSTGKIPITPGSSPANPASSSASTPPIVNKKSGSVTAPPTTSTTTTSGNMDRKGESKGDGDGGKRFQSVGASASASSESALSSLSMTSSDSESNKRPVIRPNAGGKSIGKLLESFGEEIGDDVRLVVTLLENAGLCGPISSVPSASSRSETSGVDFPPARPSTAEKPFRDSILAGMGDAKDRGRPTTALASPSESSEKESISRRKETPNRPTTATRSRTTPSPFGASERNKDKEFGQGKVLGEPKLSRGGRASAPSKANTTTTQTSTLRENIKSSRSRSIGGSGTQESARPKTALPSVATSRSRLYQHTASSAQKGILGVSPSAHNLSESPSGTALVSPSASKSTRPKTAGFKMGDSTAGAGDKQPATLTDQFAAFSRFGDTASDGKHITLSNCDKWMKQAKVIDAKKITTTDTSICFKKLFKTAKKVTQEDFKKYVEELAKSKKLEPQDLLDKLTNCGPPGLSTSTKAAHAGVVERLTDTSKYTGSHKERFDASGKGKGLEGRRDNPDGSGYVASFKEKLDLNKGASPSPSVTGKAASPAPAK